MEAIKHSIVLPRDHRVHFDLTVPESIASGAAEVLVVVQPKGEKIPVARELGTLAGKARVADDFDAPLPDAFWLGKDA